MIRGQSHVDRHADLIIRDAAQVVHLGRIPRWLTATDPRGVPSLEHRLRHRAGATAGNPGPPSGGDGGTLHPVAAPRRVWSGCPIIPSGPGPPSARSTRTCAILSSRSVRLATNPSSYPNHSWRSGTRPTATQARRSSSRDGRPRGSRVTPNQARSRQPHHRSAWISIPEVGMIAYRATVPATLYASSSGIARYEVPACRPARIVFTRRRDCPAAWTRLRGRAQTFPSGRSMALQRVGEEQPDRLIADVARPRDRPRPITQIVQERIVDGTPRSASACDPPQSVVPAALGGRPEFDITNHIEVPHPRDGHEGRNSQNWSRHSVRKCSSTRAAAVEDGNHQNYRAAPPQCKDPTRLLVNGAESGETDRRPPDYRGQARRRRIPDPLELSVRLRDLPSKDFVY